QPARTALGEPGSPRSSELQPESEIVIKPDKIPRSGLKLRTTTACAHQTLRAQRSIHRAARHAARPRRAGRPRIAPVVRSFSPNPSRHQAGQDSPLRAKAPDYGGIRPPNAARAAFDPPCSPPRSPPAPRWGNPDRP